MSELSRLVRIARTDFSYFFRTKWVMAALISLSLSDMLVTALVYGRLITKTNFPFDYFRFLVPGIVVLGLFSAATDTGRRIWLALREGVVQYYMTLPIRTTGLVGAYIVSGGLGGIVYSGILLTFALVLVRPQNVLNALFILPFLFILSAGIAGLAGFFASISRRGEIYWVYAQALQVFMITVSTVFYPVEIVQKLPAPLSILAQYNPLSLAAGILRDSAFGHSDGSVIVTVPLDLTAISILLAISLSLAGLGALAYWIILRTIRLRGKP